MTEKLSPKQRLAVETLDRDVSISAGAGSGKTRVLVERFCRIIREKQARIDEIPTVTFTEKAAKEMKERMVKCFAELRRETGEARFETAGRRIENAYIGTIHSFAARMLRENAFEAGIDPRFSVLTDVEAEILKNKILEELRTEAKELGTKAYIDLIRAYGEPETAAAVKKLHNHLCGLGKEVIDIPVAEDRENGKQAATTFFALIDDLFSERRSGNLTPKATEAVDGFAEVFPDLKVKMTAALTALAEPDSARYTISFDWENFEELALAENFINGSVGGKTVREEIIKPAKAAAATFRTALLAPMAKYYAKSLKTVTADFRRRYAEAKRRLGMLDFDDLLLKTKTLFYRADGTLTRIAADYRAKFKFAMLDEFQDTNELQLSLIAAVCPPRRLFTVGDAKQSIFSFIHSDISVFQRRHRRVGDGDGKIIPLTENYRSRPEMIDFINWFFAKLWNEDEDFDFEELVSGRPSDYSDEHQQEKTVPVELTVVENSDDIAQPRRVEAQAIAARIKGLLEGDGNPLKARKTGDIIILFRSTSEIKFYEQALSKADIDYYVVSGRGFFTTLEVRDMINLLKITDNPLDDIAMAAVLRSPLVGVSADALWWLTRDLPDSTAGDGETLDKMRARRATGKLFAGLDNVESLTDLSKADQTKLLDFKATLSRLHAIRSESKITRLIDLALELTDYDLKLLALPNGKRKFANIRKLLDIAEAFAVHSLFSLSDFIRHIESLATIADREGEAATETEGSPVVRLMTVHKAKGLEAPVVFVADCSRPIRTGRSNPFIFDKDLGLACKVRSPLADKIPVPAAYASIAEHLKRRAAEEEKRLLYVAATRAKELLIFTGSKSLTGKALEKAGYFEVGSWLGWLERALEIRTATTGEKLTAGKTEVAFRLAAEQTADEEVPAEPAAAEKYKETLIGGELLPIDDADASDFQRCLVVPGKAQAPVDLGVSQAVDWLACPEKYRLRWKLGLDEPFRKARKKTPGRISKAVVGSAVHEILASVDFRKDPEAQINIAVRNQNPLLRNEAARYCAALLASGWPDRLAASKKLFQEIPFSVALENVRLVGRIDLLFKENAGWVVADYKTGSGTVRVRYADQVKLYALALKKCLDMMPIEVVLIGLGDGKDFSRPVDPKNLIEIERRLVEAGARIRNNDFTVEDFSRCADCGYKGRFCLT